MTRCVTLLDGTIASSACESWRAECEARTVCQMPTPAARREFLSLVEKHRGARAREQLELLARQLWELAYQPKATRTAR